MNPRRALTLAGFQDRCFQPLSHPSNDGLDARILPESILESTNLTEPPFGNLTLWSFRVELSYKFIQLMETSDFMTMITDPIALSFLTHTQEAVFLVNDVGDVIAHSAACQALLGVGFHVGVSCIDQFPQLFKQDSFIQALNTQQPLKNIKVSLSTAEHSPKKIISIDSAPIQIDQSLVSAVWMREMIDQHTSPPWGFNIDHDPLTKLPTRFHLTLLLDQLTGKKDRRFVPNDSFALLLLDLDRFKLINDTLGHQQGDQAVSILGQRLQAFLQDEFVKAPHYVSRLGGDEFAVILTGNPSQKLVEEYAHAIMECLSRPFKLGDREVFMTTSIGACFYPQDGHDNHSLLRHAEIALYHAKSMGGYTYQFYIPHAQESGLERLELEADLRKALERNEFEIDYQPQIDLASGDITGFEALIRWQHPERGRLSPGIFIPILEDTGLIDSVGIWLIETACEQLNALKKRYKRPFKMAVNLAARQFNNPRLTETILALLKTHRIDPKELEMEMTESLLMSRHQETLSTLQALAIVGIRLSIDDFGTGYSSLAYLKRFPIDTLKINQSFVVDLERNSDDATLIKAIIAMAKSLNITVVAEGVETEFQQRFLQEQNCDIAQGYLISRPLLKNDVFNWLDDYQKQTPATKTNQNGAPINQGSAKVPENVV